MSQEIGLNEKPENDFDQEMDVEVDDEFNDNEEGQIDNGLFTSKEDKRVSDSNGDFNEKNNNDSTTTSKSATNNNDKDNKKIEDDKKLFELPEFTRKDKTLSEILELMDENVPIIPDAVIDYYMTKNGFNCSDKRVKRLLALATQKFISDITTDAYEYSRIRSSVSVSNANNGQSRARQLLAAQQQQQQQQLTQQQQQQNEKNTQSKVVLTVSDLSAAVSEYGLNITRPDFYR
ncbi:hypothetical protein Kpol_397p10 [Vanderwaltozyma polyspora DSM 70294]|uniref:Transcription initiation factor TFIID subunit 10 n=1 Tax=Vanderwaltozyma polyspora (strain ATCC 22028 / DSM 70294 / BCRC 21397 / CBS 2163 / NBRC 10782 / NRRL Y-8283 / UCD 57-17) TaxID=436907 RepID=A7TRG1_VANPO|nr:uncharacterized protein Kpol_397p10 [Vanderwaltozyma polyspora DSM 70294]EDO15150.1 hypothetical protein Kpol_397p10 [Vanderwaltozyma polyspora DSM 70294]